MGSWKRVVQNIVLNERYGITSVLDFMDWKLIRVSSCSGKSTNELGGITIHFVVKRLL